jgi:flavin reductase (DIM6/NTAB) family NADH-FMN oxidoreductase RutF
MNVTPIIQPSDLRTFAGNFPTGIAVVTLCDSKGDCFGVTMNSVTTLSLSPPLLLICLDNTSNTLSALSETSHFCLHYLAEHQSDLSNIFASKRNDKFATLDYSISELGCPLIPGVVATSECRVVNTYPGGDHTIVIGQLQNINIHGGEPLLFHRGSYASVMPLKKTA